MTAISMLQNQMDIIRNVNTTGVYKDVVKKLIVKYVYYEQI